MILLGSCIMVVGATLQCTAFSLPRLIGGVRSLPELGQMRILTRFAESYYGVGKWYEYIYNADLGE